MGEPAIHLSPEAALHDLRTLIASAPPGVRRLFGDFDDGDYERYGDAARRKADWCEAMAANRTSGTVDFSPMPEHNRAFFRDAAALLRVAIPSLPEHAPPDTRPSVEWVYSEAERTANRRGARRRRR
jgi:hypothetical protein